MAALFFVQANCVRFNELDPKRLRRSNGGAFPSCARQEWQRPHSSDAMRTRILRPAAVLAATLFCLTFPAAAGDALAPLRVQFTLPDHRVDYAAAKLVVDRLISPETDVASVHMHLDRWERAVRANIPENANARQTFDALVRTLYEPGPWNGHSPFAYDLDDPLGKKPENRQLATYLSTRKGNCVSMPILVVILGQRLGLPIALATAPKHALAKFADDTQQAWLNFEATAGGFKADSSYERELGITPEAMDNGLYLRPLTPREGLGVIASSLMEHYARQGNGDALIAVADMALQANPRDSDAILSKGNAYYIQLQQRYVRVYPRPVDIPREKVQDYLRLSRENLAWFAKAEALGWKEPAPEWEAEYLRSIEREKARRAKAESPSGD